MRAALIIGAAASLALVACPDGPPPSAPRPPAAETETATALPPPSADGRLPVLAVPRAYALELEVDPNQPRFKGTVRIEADIPAKTSWIVMHGRGLAVKTARAVMDRREPRPAQVTTRVAAGGKVPEELVLGFGAPLPPGHVTLVLEYDAPFDDELAGLYRVKDGESWYAFSQFEATDARRAFPCFDEPVYKVPFDIALVVPSAMKAVSNVPETMREDVPPGRTRVRFARTKPLPTYLLAFAVGDLVITDATRSARPPVRMITTKKAANPAQNKLALEATSELVDRLGTWFGIPYPYEKLDIVAVPALAAGAMENPGLVTFRDDLLLVDPVRGSTRARRDQALVIAHELAHQWFGNLVTAAWWTDVWLNEGMATWMQNRIVDAWHPEWGVRLDAVREAHDVMDQDGLMSARAVRQPAVSTSDIESAFDHITYEKGAAVLQMLEHWVGEAKFKSGIRDYLNANANTSVGTNKLFEALDKATGKDVTGMASSYLDQPGVPELVASVNCEQGGRWHVELGSRPWRPIGSTQRDDDPRYWNVPVCVLTEGAKAEQCVDLMAGLPSLVAGRSTCPKWVHPNSALSYYRWSVPPKTYVALAQAKSLEPAARLSLLSNAWSSVRSGDLDARYMLDVLPGFDTETAQQTATEAIAILHEMSDTIVEEDARPAFKKFALARLSKRKKIEDPLLRRSVQYAMADVAEDEATLHEADDTARRWLADPTSVDPDTASTAVDLASRKAGDDRIDALIAALKKSTNPQDRQVALHALAGFEDAKRLEKALDRALTADVERDEVRLVVASAMARRTARPTAEAWMQKHWDEVHAKLPGHLVLPVVRSLGFACTAKEADEITTFYTPRTSAIPGAERSLKEAAEEVGLCVALRRKAAVSISNALAKRK
ncbi:MAG: M1 family aminopeptidase [Labilithrix sp.]